MFDSKDLLGKMFEGGKPGWDKKGGGDYGTDKKKGYDDDAYDKKAAYAKEAAREKEAWAKKADDDDDVAAAKKAAYLKSQSRNWGAPTAAAGGAAAATGGGFLSGLGALFGGGGNAAPASPSIAERFGGTAARVGGLALIGGLAYAAYRAYSARNAPGAQAPAPAPAPTTPATIAPPPPNSGFTPPPQDSAAQNALGTLLIRAMITAAKADGQIDAQETQRIFGEMSAQTLSQAEKAFLMEEIGKPVDVDALASQAQTPQVAAQVYAASVMVIDAQSPQEAQYLQTLAQKLRLEAPLVAEIHQQVQAAAARPAQ